MQELLVELWRELSMTIFMVTHDIHEAFKLGTRVLVFDKVRHDPDAPEAYGATITYDLDLDRDGNPAVPEAGRAVCRATNNKKRRCTLCHDIFSTSRPDAGAGRIWLRPSKPSRRHHPDFDKLQMRGWKAVEKEGMLPSAAGRRSASGRCAWA